MDIDLETIEAKIEDTIKKIAHEEDEIRRRSERVERMKRDVNKLTTAVQILRASLDNGVLSDLEESSDAESVHRSRPDRRKGRGAQGEGNKTDSLGGQIESTPDPVDVIVLEVLKAAGGRLLTAKDILGESYRSQGQHPPKGWSQEARDEMSMRLMSLVEQGKIEKDGRFFRIKK